MFNVRRNLPIVGKFFKRKLDRSLDRVRQKGHERLTVMIIPHGQEEVFSLQLNWSMIFFLVGSLMMALILSVYGAYWQIVKKREVDNLKLRYGINLHNAVKVESGAEERIELQNELFDRLRIIATLVGIPEKAVATLPESDQAEEMARRSLESEVIERLDFGPGSDYLPPVYSLETNFNLMKDQQPLLVTTHESVKYGYGIFTGMPLGRPVAMNGNIFDTSLFGRRINPIQGTGIEIHEGIDMSAPYGTPVYATAAGTVYSTVYSGTGYGNVIIIQHDYGYYSLFAHLSGIYVRKGQWVTRRQKIGAVGRSGRATGSHLHYEVRLGNVQKINPLPFVCGTDLVSKSCVEYNRKDSL